MPGTAYTDNLMATALSHGTSYQGPATVYLALVTTSPSKTVAGTEATIAAVTIARSTFAQSGWTNDGAGSLTNTADVSFTEATGDFDADVVAIEAYTALTSGTRLWYIILSSPRTILNSQTPKFLAGDLTLTVA